MVSVLFSLKTGPTPIGHADANRAQADWKLCRAAVQCAEESVAVTAARLANRRNSTPRSASATRGDRLSRST